MKKGKIIETGTHDQLIKKSGKYKKLNEFHFVEDVSEPPFQNRSA